MSAVPSELRDVRVLALAALTLVANLLLQVPAAAASLAAVAVVVAFALFRRLYPAKATDASAGARPFAGLSRREVEIVRLVADGLSNKEIGARLFISERTVDNHVQHVLNKLGVHSRAQVAVWAAEHGLLTAGER